LTGDQHTDHILTEQRVSRYSSRPDVFYFFSHRTFLKTILASRTNGTFAFAPTAQANPSAKAKEPFFPTAPIKMINLIINITTRHKTINARKTV
jgi:hypothetical protein